jgi:DDE superfamily endonuclease
VANGEVLGLCQERYRHQEWIKFLRLIDRTIPLDRQLYLICDNYATHKQPKVQRWRARHPRFPLHCTPTSPSWLNRVDGHLTLYVNHFSALNRNPENCNCAAF